MRADALKDQALDLWMTRAVELRRTILQATLMHAVQCG
jgi:hypothetical protein